ncbi:exodeoxyribonuclease VII small subunit [Seleniivibrio woodruffii]|uniref:Exodeoxyribonuclease 7 small subunit n=1 Tax=Seleniivibrio woodruffii TaxID=1078050 RepID=A0A4R1KDH5_9BACT|nr:exodeoxyribonuclease VII small subunit [Seleniivibrio woodruffii]TCK62594.1 exodeoxyribonuclease VII small subunit [Seleniivibrio woodruffii]TVZ36980.1 exodeoxyribonuclease VII small subunit [Seleniivibrio woodruffii]
MSGEKFEQKLKKLEEIVEKLENGEVDIEENLKLFQEGMKLGKECRKMLDDIELKVSKVLSAEGDEVKTESFDEPL